MPLVVVQYKSGRVLEDMLMSVAKALPHIVAGALHVKGNPAGHLTATEVEVWVQESGPHDVNVKDLEIIIWANEYPERRVNLERRKEVILDGVRSVLVDYDYTVSGFVWVILQPAAFGEF